MNFKISRINFYLIFCGLLTLLTFLESEQKSFIFFLHSTILTFTIHSLFIGIIESWSVLFLSIYITIKTYTYTLGFEIGKEAIAAFFLSNLTDFKSFIGYEFVFLTCILVFIVYLKSKIKLKKSHKDYLIIAVSIVIGLLTTFLPKTEKISNLFFKTQPYTSIGDLIHVIKKHKESKKVILNDVFHKLDTANFQKDTDIILVIGESARGDRFSLNGYKKETNPMLKKQKNIYSFNAESCSNSTNLGVPCLLSYQTKSRFSLPEKYENIVLVMKKLGFKTHYYSIQNLRRNIDIIKSCELSDVCKMGIGGLDENLIQKLKNALKNTKTPNFIILHQHGSHTAYHERFREDFAKFTPYCTKNPRSCKKQELDNVYDNTILYTDFVLNNIIENLKNRKSVMFYTSDHGESLGELGRLGLTYGHGGLYQTNEQKNVPFIIWHSDKFSSKKLSLKNTPKLSHDSLFFSILGSLNISLKDKKDTDNNLNIFQ